MVADGDNRRSAEPETAAVREPYVFPIQQSPFSPEVPPLERRRRVLDVGAEVVTDEAGAVIDFMSEVDVEGILNDSRFASVAMPTLRLSGVEDGPLWDLWSQLMFAKDADEHRRIRGVVNREFSTRRTDRLRPGLERAANDLCDAIPTGADVDMWDAYAYPFAARVACQMVGIPEEDADQAAVWAFDLARAFFPFMSPERKARAERSAAEMLAYMDELLARRRREPTDDLISILASDDVPEHLTVEEIRALAANMVFAGLEATAKGVSTGTYLLLSQGQLATLAERPEAVSTAVLEVLRFAPPAQNVARFAPHDMVCQHVQLRAGQVVSANIVAACRDPRRYDNPDEFDIDREPGKQLAFGAGPHYCLGANLARLGLGIAFETLARRHPGLELVDGTGNVEWDYEGFAGIVHLECRVP
jgi:cytochrome P450